MLKGAAEAEETVAKSDSAARLEPLPLTVIAPPSGWTNIDLRELWRYRELLFFLIWRDAKVRYKQTVFGASWAIIRPFVTMVVFSVFFGGLLNVPSDDIPYPIFSYTALVPWSFFSSSLGRCAESLVSHANILTKVYFPRLVLPIAAGLSGLLDFAPSFIILLGMMLVYGMTPTINVVWLLPFMLTTLMTMLGVGFWLAALNVQFRDVSFVVSFLAQVWLYATPVIYPISLVSDAGKALYLLNPMASVIEGFRWALLGKGMAPSPELLVPNAIALVLLVTGALYFRRMENYFADVV